MIKKILGLFLKLPFLLIIIVLSSLIVWESLGIVGEYQRADNKKEKIEENNDGYSRLNESLMDYLVRILVEYKKEGILGVARSYEEMSRENSYCLFSLVIADAANFYDSGADVVYSHNGSYEENHDQTLKLYRDTPTEIRIARATELYTCDKYGYKQQRIYDYLGSVWVEYLKTIAPNLTIRICATKSGVEYFYADNDEHMKFQYQLVDEDLNEYVSDAVERIVIYSVAFALMWLLLVCGIKKKVEETETRGRIEKFNSELMLILAGVSVACIAYAIYYFCYIIPYTNDRNIEFLQISAWAKASVAAAILFSMIAIFIKKIFRRCILKDSLIAKIIKYIVKVAKETYGREKYGSDKDIKRCYVRKVCMDVIITIIMFNAVLKCIFDLDDTVVFMGWALLVFYIFYIYHSVKEYKYLRLFNKVNLNIDYVYQGMYECVDRNDASEIMMKLANLSQGFKQSVAKQIEAEKLQVELITNVSHDLKTPLTSIISYVDLLSKEELPAVAADYVKILVNKSDRLKSIVSDVFDLAKASSGEEIELESLDGMVLINQVLSDMDDAIKASGREIKLKSEIEAATITGNGQKLYRVFQNVIGNALKYSMPGTRIFINTYLQGNDFVFNIKNVSEYEIDFTAEEILSRFSRGDKARNSEGNGLGLAIAKSFTEQCGGSFAVSLDDDMFKVMIRLR